MVRMFIQPSLFPRRRRAVVSFPTWNRRGRKPVEVRGGTRTATRKFSGDSWFRKVKF